MKHIGDVTIDTAVLDALIAKLPDTASRLVRACAEAVEGKAKDMAPFKTGALRNSLIASEQSKTTWWIQDGMDYGIYQELGFTHYLSGKRIQNPFLVPACEWARPQFEASLKELFKP